MARMRFGWWLAPALVVLLVMPGGISATPASDAIDRLAQQGKRLAEQLGKAQRLLSAGGQQFLVFHNREEDIRRLSRFDFVGRAASPSQIPGPGTYANDIFAPSDFLSRLVGMTQSETSNAWCGQNAIIGFNDSGSFMETFLTTDFERLSFNGWSHSSNAGQTFTDRGALVVPSLPSGTQEFHLFGDPVAACTSENAFYQSALAFQVIEPRFRSGIAVARSRDGGRTFPSVVMAVDKGARNHFLDKEWMAADPGPTPAQGDDVLHVTYTDFDFSFNSVACGRSFRVAIEHVRSTDGGETWSAPRSIDQRCGNRFVQGSQVEVRGDDVWVAWERYAADFVTRTIRIRHSTDGGATWAPAVVVTPVTPVGDGFISQGAFRNFLDLQGLAVDRSGGPRDGTLYVTFQDGSRVQQRDPVADFFGGGCLPDGPPRYCFGDAYATTSPDGGATWSTPVMIHPSDGETDQYMPHVEVDAAGRAWALFHDRSVDPRNFLIDVSLFASTDGGRSWTRQPMAAPIAPPVTGWQDFVVNPFYMGDYIGLATDRLESLPGVLSSWGDQALGDQNVAYDPP